MQSEMGRRRLGVPGLEKVAILKCHYLEKKAYVGTHLLPDSGFRLMELPGGGDVISK